MMSNKRGPEDIHGDGTPSPPQSEAAPPKRSKLDFLAMIAEMSEKKEVAPKEAAVPVAPAQADIAFEEEAKSGGKPVIKKPFKSDGPKSSFAAWKLAKGRKNGSKSPNRKDITLGRQSHEIAAAVGPATETSVTPTPEAAMSVLKEAIEMKTSAAAVVTPTTSSLVDPMEALAAAAASRDREMITPPLLPPKKALKHKDPSAKKSVPPKKAGSSFKKGKEAMSTKKVAKKKATADGSGKVKGAGKSKSKKGDHSSAKTSTFPEKIMELLQGGLASNAIYWLPEGEAIAVDPDNFKDSTVISKQFRGNKLSSFVRSLNRWGFRRIFYHSLPDKTLAFYHRLFQKQAPLLVKEMKMDGGEKEPAFPPGALPSSMMTDGKSPAAAAVVQADLKPEDSPVSVRQMVANPAESAPTSPTVSAPAPSVQVSVSEPSSPPDVPVSQDQVLSAVLSAAQPGAAQSLLERASALELAEGQHALQQAMVAEQERSDLALQQLQAHQILLQSLAEQQSAAQAEELLMQSMLAEQQRSDLALQQHQAEQALIQQILAEEQTAALAAALNGSAGAGGLSAEALLRERLLAEHYASAPGPGSDILALLQQQLQGQQQQAREPSYMEQLLLLEQQQQRQHEAALLAAHGFRF